MYSKEMLQIAIVRSIVNLVHQSCVLNGAADSISTSALLFPIIRFTMQPMPPLLTKRQEFARGWPVLVATTLGTGTGIAPLMFYSLGAFVEPLGKEFGWSLAEITAAPLFMTFGFVATGAAVGAFADRFGARRVTLLSLALFVPAIAALSLIRPQVWTLYLGYFLLAIVGAGSMPITWTRVVTGWFMTGRGLALGLSLFGTGICGMLLPSYATWLIDAFGWRAAYVGLALVPLVFAAPMALLFFHEPPQDLARRAATPSAGSIPAQDWGVSFKDAARSWPYWQMILGFFIAAMAIGSVLVHAIPLLTERGVNRGTAAAVFGLFGLAVSGGRLVSGYLLDIFHGPRLAIIMFSAPALACVLLLVSGDNLVLSGLAIILVGLIAGAEHDIAAYFVSRYYGRRNYGAIYGLLYTLYGLGSASGSPLAGWSHGVTGSYNTSLYFGVVAFLAAAAMLGTLGQYPKQEGDRAPD